MPVIGGAEEGDRRNAASSEDGIIEIVLHRVEQCHFERGILDDVGSAKLTDDVAVQAITDVFAYHQTELIEYALPIVASKAANEPVPPDDDRCFSFVRDEGMAQVIA